MEPEEGNGELAMALLFAPVLVPVGGTSCLVALVIVEPEWPLEGHL